MQPVDLRRVFSSKHLDGLFGIKAVIPEAKWGCGAAALTSILNHSNIHVNQSHVVEGTGTTRQMGTSWKGILKYAGLKRMRATLTAETPFNAVLAGIRSRRYALLDWADLPGHWVLVVGYEPVLSVLTFLDPIREGNAFFGMLLKDFKAMWEGQNRADPRIMILMTKANREHKTAKGLEERSNFRIEDWAVVHHMDRSGEAGGDQPRETSPEVPGAMEQAPG